MSISNTNRRVSYTISGTGPYTINFVFLANADLKVYDTTPAGVITLLTLTTDYSLTGAGDAAGGELTLVSPTAGNTLTIINDPDILQTTEYPEAGPFPAKSHETALDKLTIIAKRLYDLNLRSFRFGDGVTAGAVTIDKTIAQRAGKALIFGVGGDIDVSVDDYINQAANAAASAAAADAARVLSEAAQAAAEAVYDAFDDRYLGVKASPPSVDNDGNPLIEGALYYNSGDKKFYVWNSTTWVSTFPSGVSPFISTLLDDVNQAAAKQTLGIGFDVKGTVSYSGTYQLTISDYGYLIYAYSPGGSDLTLPDVSTGGNSGASIVFYNIGSGDLIIRGWSGQQLYAQGKEAVTNITLKPGSGIALTNNQNTNWVQLAGEPGNKADNVSTQTIFIPGTAFYARTTNGPASGSSETPTNKVMQKGWDFDAAVNEYIQSRFTLPKGWNTAGTISGIFIWDNLTNTTGNVVWAFHIQCRQDGNGVDLGFGTPVSATDDTGGVADRYRVSAETSGATIGGALVAEKLASIQVYRDAVNASDTATADARFLGIILKYTTTSLNDA